MGEAIRIDRGREHATDALSAAFRASMRDACGTFEQREAAALGVWIAA